MPSALSVMVAKFSPRPLATDAIECAVFRRSVLNPPCAGAGAGLPGFLILFILPKNPAILVDAVLAKPPCSGGELGRAPKPCSSRARIRSVAEGRFALGSLDLGGDCGRAGDTLRELDSEPGDN